MWWDLLRLVLRRERNAPTRMNCAHPVLCCKQHRKEPSFGLASWQDKKEHTEHKASEQTQTRQRASCGAHLGLCWSGPDLHWVLLALRPSCLQHAPICERARIIINISTTFGISMAIARKIMQWNILPYCGRPCVVQAPQNNDNQICKNWARPGEYFINRRR